MPIVLSRRRLAVLVFALAVVALAGSFAISRPDPAGAQVATSTGVISNFPVLATNGHSNLPEFSGSGDGVLGVACTGASPRGGPNIPAQVITQLRSDLTYLRILHNNGTPLDGTVRINCVLEVESGPALARLRAAANQGG
ncbi:MAG TPA: hypothetical protein VHO93_06795 [Actinomycetota bacterium]|jgi:hypothetical protein|nr:hypothetical protein [Actinomycetota bacterium]